jgi:hypothetical protein
MTLKPLDWVSLVLFAAFSASAHAQTTDLPPLPDRNPQRAPAVAKSVLPGEQPTVPWTDAEIAAATAKCKELLTGDPLDYDLLPPIKQGICGTPAPVLLRAVGTDPKVTIDPPATLSCPMADMLGEWLRDTVQPEAKELFGSTVVKVLNASSYSCRNRYGGANTPLSEHALANAFDVSEFVLANGVHVTVLDNWPHVAPPPAPERNPARTIAEQDGSPSKRMGSDQAVVTPAKAEHAAPPSPPPAATEPVPDPKSQFVTFLFDDACRRFGTVLGPNANEAHKNHFHLDMKQRRSSYCE